MAGISWGPSTPHAACRQLGDIMFEGMKTRLDSQVPASRQGMDRQSDLLLNDMDARENGQSVAQQCEDNYVEPDQAIPNDRMSGMFGAGQTIKQTNDTAMKAWNDIVQ